VFVRSLIEVCLSLADVSCHRARVQRRGTSLWVGMRETSEPVAICDVEMAIPVSLKQALQMKDVFFGVFLDCQPHAGFSV
jgi:hypothetical protein